MNENRTPRRRTSAVALAAVVIAASVAGTALAASAQPEVSSAAAPKAKKLTKLNKRLRALEERVAAAGRQPGPSGAPGAPGAPGATDVVVRRASVNVGPGPAEPFEARCDPGEIAIGGGVGYEAVNPGDAVLASFPSAGGSIPQEGQTPDGWLAAVHNGSVHARVATTFVICARP